MSTLWTERLAASRVSVYCAFTLLYLIPTVRLCLLKLFWDDEFFTFYISRAGGWKGILDALHTGADQHPPTFYYLTHCITAIFGTSHLTLRLPAVFGFWLLCICLYEIVRSLTTPTWAVFAMLFPLATNFYYYASEARGYGLVVGFSALAVLAWLKASSGEHRRVFVPVLAFAVAAAVASHYYAGLIMVCLGFAEIARTVARRKLDVPIWIAFAFSLLPVVAFLGTIRSAQGYSKHFWAVPVWSDALAFYSVELWLGLVVVAVALSFAVSFPHLSFGGRSAETSRWTTRRVLLPWQWSLIWSLSALPLIAMLLAKFITHGFTFRYAIPALVGCAILVSCVLYRAAPHPLAALVTVLACLCLFGLQYRILKAKLQDERTEFAKDQQLLETTAPQQIAVMDITVFHRLSFYSPRELASRSNYLTDPAASVRYLGQDTIDRGLEDLSPWFGIKVLPAQSFLAQNHQFVAFGASDGWAWVTYELPKWGNAKLLRRVEHGRLLFSVNDIHVPADPKLLQAQSAVEARRLYNRLPRTGPSLCKLYMGAGNCPL